MLGLFDQNGDLRNTLVWSKMQKAQNKKQITNYMMLS